jgi:hypothetical protein
VGIGAYVIGGNRDPGEWRKRNTFHDPAFFPDLALLFLECAESPSPR